MPQASLAIYDRLPGTGDPGLEAALERWAGAETVEGIPAEVRELERPWRAFVVLRDPVERVRALYGDLNEVDRERWGLADIYRRLGGDGPRQSEEHARFADFFNGQARAIVAPWRDAAKLEFWAGLPDHGALLRDRALELLERHYVVGVQEQLDRSFERFAIALGFEAPGGALLGREERLGPLDPQTRSLILAHNQLDAELHAHFRGAVERDPLRPRPRLPKPSVRPGAVCVLGAPRSGTSLTTRILNVLGLDLGNSEGLMRAAAGNNPAGFWEHEGIADLNEDILATLSDRPPPFLQGWRWPPALEAGWERDHRLEPIRDAARAILHHDFGEASSEGSPFGWKDPRSCLTLPFWQQLAPQMRYVICVREPMDVAASLASRDRMPTEEALRLWLRYMAQAVIHTGGEPRVFVAYEDYFAAWEEQASRLAAFLDTPSPGKSQRETIAAHLDERLWHHRGAAAKVDEASPSDLGEAVTRLHAALMRLCHQSADTSQAAEAELDAAARDAMRILAQG